MPKKGVRSFGVAWRLGISSVSLRRGNGFEVVNVKGMLVRERADEYFNRAALSSIS